MRKQILQIKLYQIQLKQNLLMIATILYQNFRGCSVYLNFQSME